MKQSKLSRESSSESVRGIDSFKRVHSRVVLLLGKKSMARAILKDRVKFNVAYRHRAALLMSTCLGPQGNEVSRPTLKRR